MMFSIRYRCPETHNFVTVERDFYDFRDTDTGQLIMTAQEVAEDWAYTVADKGHYTVEMRHGFN